MDQYVIRLCIIRTFEGLTALSISLILKIKINNKKLEEVSSFVTFGFVCFQKKSLKIILYKLQN